MDIIVRDHGSIVILVPLTGAAANWVAHYLHADNQRWAGGVAVEPRYLLSILSGAVADGLEVES